MKNKSKKILTKFDVLTGMLCLVGMIPGLIYYNQMPEQVPIHFDVNNQPDNYAAKPFVVLFIPLLMIVLHLFGCITENTLSTKDNPRPVKVISRLLIPALTIVIETVTVMYVMDMFTDIALICSLIIGIIFILMGNYLPKTQPNPTFGIKLPWTIHNEYVWHKTHRLAGWMTVFGGIIIISAAFFKAYCVCVGTILAIIIVPLVYSLMISRKKS